MVFFFFLSSGTPSHWLLFCSFVESLYFKSLSGEFSLPSRLHNQRLSLLMQWRINWRRLQPWWFIFITILLSCIVLVRFAKNKREPTNSTHIWHRVWKSNPGHIGGRRLLSPLHHHCSPTWRAVKSITIIITLKGIEKIKTQKKKWQQNRLENISFTNAVRKYQQILRWLLDFDCLLTSYNYVILAFHWFIWAG